MFSDIFGRLEEVEKRRLSAVLEIWKEITSGIYQCKITGRIWAKEDFEWYEDAVREINFVVEVWRVSRGEEVY